jgi:hypothetical protein
MNNMIMNLITDFETTGNTLNTVKAELRTKELNLKTKKLELEFDPEYTKGLKVKEIAPKIHKDLLPEMEEICELKAKRDELELKFEVLKLQIKFIGESDI